MLTTPNRKPHVSHRHQRQPVGVHQRHEHAAEQVVERGEQDEQHQPGHGVDRLERAADVDAAGRSRRRRGRLRLLDVDACGRCTSATTVRASDDVERPAHAELADDEAAEHRRDGERDARDRADQAVGPVAPVLGDEQRHARRHGDAAHLAGHRAEQGEPGQQPEPRVAQLQQVVGVDGDEHRRGGGEATRRDRRRQHHRRLLAVPVDVRAERRSEHGRRDAERAADHAGGDDRAGLQVHPERQGEPQERARDAADERVDEEAPERVLTVRQGVRRLLRILGPHSIDGIHARCHDLVCSCGRRWKRRRTVRVELIGAGGHAPIQHVRAGSRSTPAAYEDSSEVLPKSG